MTPSCQRQPESRWQHNINLQEATTQTRRSRQPNGPDLEEGYVATWYRNGQTPFRLKIKYIEYLRLHRMVTGMSPKHIWETLSQGLDTSEYVEHSTPWFKEFFEKWQRVFMTEYVRTESAGRDAYAAGLDAAGDWDNHGNLGQLRKAFAIAVQDSKYASIAFAMLDGKEVRPIIWKQVKRLASNAHTLRDATQ